MNKSLLSPRMSQKMCWEAMKGRKDKNIIEALWKTGFTKLLRQLWEPCNNKFLQIVLYDKYNIELLRESGYESFLRKLKQLWDPFQK